MNHRYNRRCLAIILLAGVVVRAGLVAWFHGEPLYIVDEQSYNEIAIQLCRDGEYAHAPGQLTSQRPPLYPFVLAAVYSVAGLENYTAVRGLQAVLSLLNVVVVFKLAERMYCPRVALVAAGAMCFYPSLLGANCLLLTETLFTLLLCGFAWLLQWSYDSKRLVALFAAGAVLGLAALARSVMSLFPPFVAFYLLAWPPDRDRRWMRRVIAAAAPVVAFAIVIAPWSVRNTRLQQTFITIDVMGGRNFMMGNYEHTPLYRAWDAISLEGDTAWHRVLARENPDVYASMTQGQRDKLAMKYGLRFALAHPGLTVQRDIVKFLNFWQLERELVAGAAEGFWGVRSKWCVLALAVVIVGVYVAAMLAGMYGFCLVPSGDRRMDGLLLLLVGFVCAVHTAVFGHSRYHLPLMPFVLTFAAAGVVHWRSAWGRRREWPFRIATVICVLLIAGWCWELVVVEADRLRGLLS